MESHLLKESPYRDLQVEAQFRVAVIDFQVLLEEEEVLIENDVSTMEVQEDTIHRTILNMAGIQIISHNPIHIILEVTVPVEEVVLVEVYDLMRNISEIQDMLTNILMEVALHRHSITLEAIQIEDIIQTIQEGIQVMLTTIDV